MKILCKQKRKILEFIFQIIIDVMCGGYTERKKLPQIRDALTATSSRSKD